MTISILERTRKLESNLLSSSPLTGATETKNDEQSLSPNAKTLICSYSFVVNPINDVSSMSPLCAGNLESSVPRSQEEDNEKAAGGAGLEAAVNLSLAEVVLNDSIHSLTSSGTPLNGGPGRSRTENHEGEFEKAALNKVAGGEAGRGWKSSPGFAGAERRALYSCGSITIISPFAKDFPFD